MFGQNDMYSLWFSSSLSIAPLYFIANTFSCSLKTAGPFCISLSPGKSFGKLFLLLLTVPTTLVDLYKRYLANIGVVHQLLKVWPLSRYGSIIVSGICSVCRQCCSGG